MSTIVAPSTPIGRGAIAVVRLSGDLSLSIIKQLANELHGVKPRRATLVKITDRQSGDTLDEVLVTYFPRPHSVTGEDVIEISCHGSPSVVRTIVDLAVQCGARIAGPGEFTLRALSNGKINLAQAEAIRDLIAAQTATAAKQASRQAGGELSKALEIFQNDLIKSIVLFESALEFVEDDLPPAELSEILESLRETRLGIAKLADTFAAGRLVREGVRIAIVGHPNVGKSSLFNRLVEQDRAIVTHVAGTTRDTLTEPIDFAGIPVILIDTAGLRETEDAVESLGIERSRRAISDADLILNVVDASDTVGPSKLDGDIQSLVVLNKSDLPVSSTYSDQKEVIRVSALTGEGLDELRAAILNSLHQDALQHDGLLITNARHHDLLRSASNELEAVLGLIERRVSEELIVVPLHNALKYLGQITGETTTEDILSQIFSTFCIGK